MTEAAVGVAAPQDPPGGPVHRPTYGLRPAAVLAQDEDRVETGMNIPIRFLDVKTPSVFWLRSTRSTIFWARGVASPTSRK